jgi:hypothetical protein
MLLLALSVIFGLKALATRPKSARSGSVANSW